MSSREVDTSAGETARPSRSRRTPPLLLLIFFAAPALGGLLTFFQVLRDGLNGVDGLRGAAGVTLSPDGAQLYAVGKDDNSLAVFRRAVGGTLEFVEVHVDGDVNGVFGLLGASGVAVASDGRHVYATAEFDDTLVVFSRDASSDNLTFVAAEVKEDLVGGVFGLNGAAAVAVSPDDEQVFVASRIDDALAVFSRDATSDELTFVEAELDGVGGAEALNGARAVAVSPDSLHVYVASEVSDAVAVFERGGGTVTYVSRVADGVGGVDGLAGASGVAVAPDGNQVYVTGRADNAVAVFTRDSGTGALTFLTLYRDGVGGVDGLAGAAAVAITPAGNRVLVAGELDDAVAVFRRDTAAGELAFLEVLRDGVDGVDGLAGALSLAATDGHAYAAGRDDDAIAAFDVALCAGDELTGDTDGDAFCDDVDLCTGDDLTGDADADGVCDDLDVCSGFDDAADTDGDGVPDGCDLCAGDDATGDTDADGVCNETDVCPGSSDAFDADGDGVPDGCDLCTGDDATGDTDADGVCNDLDACSGFDDAADADGDSVPDGCDVCTGNDATGDTDADGVCNNLDLCVGFSDNADSDGDGVPDGCDACIGDDATGDVDGDGVCGDSDLCIGDDATGDIDGDGVCADSDLCVGNDAAGDADGDGICTDLDVCVGDNATGDADNDGICADLDLCLGNNATGDADGDGICADRDCDNADPANVCLIYADGFESGGTSVWSVTVQ